MKLQSSYNCVLASVYNSLTHVHDLRFPFEYLYLSPQFFKLDHLPQVPFLLTEHPEQVVQHFLKRVGIEMRFPDIGSPAEAITYADQVLSHQSVLPMTINLRYSVLDPAPYDHDHWNLQLLVKMLDEDRYQAYDMFHDEYYEVSKEHVQQAIDTPFNRRFSDAFTPFLTFSVVNRWETESRLAAMSEASCLGEALDAYSLAANIQAGLNFIDCIRDQYLETDKQDLHDEIYKIIGFQKILIKTREQLAEFAERNGFAIHSSLHQLAKSWDTFSYGIAMAISRRKASEYDQLEQDFRKLIDQEYEQVQAWRAELGQQSASLP
ncbi:hypothetical protein [Marinicrinis sediminis]|uniref:Uncharacterized protein n=1 Tax=Marinicrinis sediminis TaxID=1652465 RepID=A0ABW5R7W2_9BACL